MAAGGVGDQQFLLSTQPRPRSAATGIMVRGIGRVKNVTSAATRLTVLCFRETMARKMRETMARKMATIIVQ
jgi:hypothetical protein